MRLKEINYNLRSTLGARDFHARFPAARDFGGRLVGLRPTRKHPAALDKKTSGTKDT